jgi:hypothetical protein
MDKLIAELAILTRIPGWPCRLLRARNERPRRRRAAEQHDELAPSHDGLPKPSRESITLLPECRCCASQQI